VEDDSMVGGNRVCATADCIQLRECASGREDPGVGGIACGGELLLISAAVAADAVSNALVGGQKYRLPRYLCGFCCFLVVAFTSMYFARIAYSLQEHRGLLETAVRNHNWELALSNLNSGMSRSIIARDSMGFFVVTIIAAWGVILMAED